MRGMQTLLPATLLVVTALPALAVPPTARELAADVEAGRQVVASQELRPAADNEVELDAATLETLSDGSHRLRTRMSLAPGESESFAYFVDRRLGTYSTMRVPPTYSDEIVALPGEETTIGLPMQGSEGPRSKLAPPADRGSCDYRATGVVIHFDPVLIELAITASTLDWNHDFASNCLSMISSNNVCFANPSTPVPPPLGPTHWFNDSCNSLNRTISIKHLQKTLFARYHNYDWHDPAEITWAQHYIQIDATTGLSTFVVSDTDGGEDALLIFGVQEVSVTELRCV